MYNINVYKAYKKRKKNGLLGTDGVKTQTTTLLYNIIITKKQSLVLYLFLVYVAFPLILIKVDDNIIIFGIRV